MKYRIEIEGLEFPGFKIIDTVDDGEVERLRKVACDNARSAVPEWKRDGDGEHLVYYYEIANERKGHKEVHVLMRPQAVKDKDFQHFVDVFQPDYVGAIHRRI